ncbi:MAG: class I SAM-dependent DNA methyltransferase [Caldilineaceae bacterium]
MDAGALGGFIWAVADLLRGDYKQSDYGKVILPFTLLRRLDCVLEATKPQVLDEYEARKQLKMPLDAFLLRKAGHTFYNTSPLDFNRLLADPSNIKANVSGYVAGFSDNARDIFERYDFGVRLDKLDSADLLYKVVQKFAAVDLHPRAVDNHKMGLIFEDLIRRFAELSNETAGEHYTPRDVIRLNVTLLFILDTDILATKGVVRSLYDPTAGTGGMLSIGDEYVTALNPTARMVLFGQELNPESYAICKADMLIKGQEVKNIVFGNTLANDGHAERRFTYMLANPPYGVDWKKVEQVVRKEAQDKGYAGRFGPGLPRVSDGSLLFVLHLCSKMVPPEEGGSRIGIVLNGSPLFTGGAGSGESEIRRWLIEHDYLETIVALPTDMFYNTGIATYVWILTNAKKPERRGKVQLINAADFYQKMRKSLGSKRKELGAEDIARVKELYTAFAEGEYSKIFDNADLGYSTITVERPQRDERGDVVVDKKGRPVADANLRDSENVPLKDDIEAYFRREVLPHVPDAWIDHSKTKVGYEIPFNRYFYRYTPPRPLEEIDAELQQLGREIMELLAEVVA